MWTVDAEGKLVDLGGPAFHWLALDAGGRFARLRVQGGAFEFVAKSIDGGALILSSDFPIALDNAFVYFGPVRANPAAARLAAEAGRSRRTRREVETRAQWLNGLAAAREKGRRRRPRRRHRHGASPDSVEPRPAPPTHPLSRTGEPGHGHHDHACGHRDV